MLIKGTLIEQIALDCKTAGYKKIIINNGAISAYPSAYDNAQTIDELPRTTWSRPAIWEIIEKYKVSGGAGNSHQHQLTNFALHTAQYVKYSKIVPEFVKLLYNDAFPAEKGQGLIIDLENLKFLDLKMLETLYK